jgi:zinc protease
VRAHFERIVVDGVPAYVGDLPEPVTAGIVFRVGSADESLLEHGLTALVAELAAVDVEGMNWIVYETSTIFFTSGTLSDVKNALTSVCAALRALSEDDLIDLADTILNEPKTKPLQPPVTILGVRFGAQSYGLGGFPRLGLLRTTGPNVNDWVSRRYSRANAVVFSTASLGQPRLGLPSGARVPPPLPTPTNILLPAWCPQDWIGRAWKPFVYFSSVMPGTDAAKVADRVVEADIRRRAEETSLTLADREANINPWSPEFDYTDFRIDVGPRVDDGVEALLGSIDDLADYGPSPEALAAAIAEFDRWTSDADATPGVGAMLAWNELLTNRPRSVEEFLSHIHAVSLTEVADVVYAMRDQAIVVVPEGAELIDPRFAMLTPTTAPPVVGLTYSAATEEDDAADNARLVVGAEGVTFIDVDQQLTVRFRDCVAALRFAHDVFMLYAADGTMISVAAAEWIDGRSALARVRAGIDPDRIVDANPEQPLQAVRVVGSDD